MVHFIKSAHVIKHNVPTTEDIMAKLSLHNYICHVILILFNKLKRNHTQVAVVTKALKQLHHLQKF